MAYRNNKQMMDDGGYYAPRKKKPPLEPPAPVYKPPPPQSTVYAPSWRPPQPPVYKPPETKYGDRYDLNQALPETKYGDRYDLNQAPPETKYGDRYDKNQTSRRRNVLSWTEQNYGIPQTKKPTKKTIYTGPENESSWGFNSMNQGYLPKDKRDNFFSWALDNEQHDFWLPDGSRFRGTNWDYDKVMKKDYDEYYDSFMEKVGKLMGLDNVGFSDPTSLLYNPVIAGWLGAEERFKDVKDPGQYYGRDYTGRVPANAKNLPDPIVRRTKRRDDPNDRLYDPFGMNWESRTMNKLRQDKVKPTPNVEANNWNPAPAPSTTRFEGSTTYTAPPPPPGTGDGGGGGGWGYPSYGGNYDYYSAPSSPGYRGWSNTGNGSGYRGSSGRNYGSGGYNSKSELNTQGYRQDPAQYFEELVKWVI